MDNSPACHYCKQNTLCYECLGGGSRPGAAAKLASPAVVPTLLHAEPTRTALLVSAHRQCLLLVWPLKWGSSEMSSLSSLTLTAPTCPWWICDDSNTCRCTLWQCWNAKELHVLHLSSQALFLVPSLHLALAEAVCCSGVKLWTASGGACEQVDCWHAAGMCLLAACIAFAEY